LNIPKFGSESVSSFLLQNKNQLEQNVVSFQTQSFAKTGIFWRFFNPSRDQLTLGGVLLKMWAVAGIFST
jgi:hypothetical protein